MPKQSRSGRLGVFAAFVVALAILAGCSSSDDDKASDDAAGPDAPTVNVVACDVVSAAEVSDVLGTEATTTDQNPDPTSCEWSFDGGHLAFSVGDEARFEEWTPTPELQDSYDQIDGLGTKARFSVSDAKGLTDEDTVAEGRAFLEVLDDDHSLAFLLDRDELHRDQTRDALEKLAEHAIDQMNAAD